MNNEHFKNYSYECIVIWASDLNKNKIEKTIEKIVLFIEGA